MSRKFHWVGTWIELPDKGRSLVKVAQFERPAEPAAKRMIRAYNLKPKGERVGTTA